MNDYEETDTAVGVNLRRLRLKAQMTQQELAERIGWQRIAIAQAESGKRRFRIDDLAALCSGLGVSYRALLAGQNDTVHDLDPHRQPLQQLIVQALGDGADEEPIIERNLDRNAIAHQHPSLSRWLSTLSTETLIDRERPGQ